MEKDIQRGLWQGLQGGGKNEPGLRANLPMLPRSRKQLTGKMEQTLKHDLGRGALKTEECLQSSKQQGFIVHCSF